MAERKPWVCPRCDLVVAPHVDAHRCPPDGGVPAVAGPGGGGGGLGGQGGSSAAAVTVTGAPHHYWAQTGSVTTGTSGTTTIPVHGIRGLSTARREMDDFPAA